MGGAQGKALEHLAGLGSGCERKNTPQWAWQLFLVGVQALPEALPSLLPQDPGCSWEEASLPCLRGKWTRKVEEPLLAQGFHWDDGPSSTPFPTFV